MNAVATKPRKPTKAELARALSKIHEVVKGTNIHDDGSLLTAIGSISFWCGQAVGNEAIHWVRPAVDDDRDDERREAACEESDMADLGYGEG